MAPYDFESYPKWATLTSHITQASVNRVMPTCGLIRTSIEYLSCPDADRPRGEKSPRLKAVRAVTDEDDLLPRLKPVPGTSTNFTSLPFIDKAATPSEVTSFHLDSIRLLDQLFTNQPTILAEVQLAFALLLVGHSTDSLAHWRRILALVANSEEAIAKYRQFFVDYLKVIQAQLPELPVELMEPTRNNSVYQDVRKLVANCTTGGLRVGDFKKSLFTKLNWAFDNLFDEDPEDLPVVVEDID